MAPIIEKLVKSRRLVRSFWVKACKHDCIDPDSKFVVLSDENPWASAYNRAMGLYLRLTQKYVNQR